MKSKEVNPKLNFNVLVTSASKKVPLINSIIDASKKISPEIKVIAADSNPNSISRYFAHLFWHMPPLNSISHSNLIDFCKDNNIRIIIPTRDGELEFFANHYHEFLKNNIHIMISPLETVKICNDKLHFHDYLKNELPIIETSSDINTLKAETFVVKERLGSGARKIALNVDKEAASRYATGLENPIFQPYIKGREISVDFYVDKNKSLKGVIPRIRDYIVNGESQITHTICDQRIIELVKRLINSLTFYGHNMIQLIEDNHGCLHVLECNCRFGGASTLSIAAGLDSFYWFIMETLGCELEKDIFVTPKENLKLIRYPSDLIINDSSI